MRTKGWRGASLTALLAGCIGSTFTTASALSELRSRLQTAPPPANGRPVTFSRDVAPILFENCAPCHRPGGSATFSLLTFQEARQHAQQLAVVTASRTMPPWKPAPGYGDFLGERRLDEKQIAAFQTWSEQGMPEGDPAQAPPVPQWTTGWELGQPDLVLAMEQPYVLHAGGPDMFRNFVIPVPLDAGRYVKAWEFHPGNPRVVHHATMQIDPTKSSRAFDAQDREPGYEGLIAPSAQAPDGFFLDWAPGHRPNVAVEGTAWQLPKASDLVMMLHLRPSGKEETVRASIGLYFSDERPAKMPVMLRLTRQHMDIPAGEKDYEVTDSYTLPVDVDAYTVQPHAHYLARQMRGYARLPDQTVKPLIFINDWDFNWQDVYTYASPVFLPAGTTVVMEITYDNSADNARNPNSPPRRVTYGQQTSDEMSELWLQVVPHSDKDRAALIASLRAHVLPEEINGRHMMLVKDPSNVALHDELALLYSETGNVSAVADEFAESLRLRPNSAAARYNVGAALLALGKRDQARSSFESALQIEPDHVAAHYNLGLLLQMDGQFEAAIGHYRQALRGRSADPETEFNLGVTLALTGSRSEGIGYLRQALQGKPDWPAALGSLAWVLAVSPDATVGERDEAVLLAQRAADLTEQRNSGVLDILATALAASGEFDRAVVAAERAATQAEIGGDERATAAFKQRLELFKRHTPYHEP